MRRVSKEINNQDTRFKHEKKEVLKTCKNASCVRMTGAGHGYNRGTGGGNLVLPTWLRMKCASSSRIPCPRSHLEKRNKKRLYYNGRSCMALNLEFIFHFFPLYTGGFEPTIFYSSGFQHFVTIKAKEDVILFRSCHLSLSLISDICT